MVPWTNRGYSKNNRIKKVQRVSLMKFLTVVVMHQQVVSNFENRKIRDVLACGATTSNSMAKQTLQLDSVCLKGAEMVFQGLLNVGGNGL